MQRCYALNNTVLRSKFRWSVDTENSSSDSLHLEMEIFKRGAFNTIVFVSNNTFMGIDSRKSTEKFLQKSQMEMTNIEDSEWCWNNLNVRFQPQLLS